MSMTLTTLMAIGENINDNSTLGERAAVGLQVTLIGMGVVFGVLLLLMGILQLFKLFATGNAKKDASPASAPAPAPVSAPPAVSAAPAAASADGEAQLVAVCSAAIAAYRGESECNFNIISIKKIQK